MKKTLKKIEKWQLICAYFFVQFLGPLATANRNRDTLFWGFGATRNFKSIPTRNNAINGSQDLSIIKRQSKHPSLADGGNQELGL